MMLQYKLPFCCQACNFSPFSAHLLAVGTSQNFGFVGAGELAILQLPSQNATPIPNGPLNNSDYNRMTLKVRCPTPNSILDIAWSESSHNVIAASMGDGCILIFDVLQALGSDAVTMPSVATPVSSLRGHMQEVASLDWNIYQRNLMVSASWDSFLRLWDVEHNACVTALNTQRGPLYAAAFSPLEGPIMAAVGADRMLSIYDIRKQEKPANHNASKAENCTENGLKKNPAGFTQLTSCIAHSHETMCVDWNKYNRNHVATGGADGTIRVWDIRRLEGSVNAPANPMNHISGAHRLPVRRIKYSPFHANVFASASYDMSVNIWDTLPPQTSQNAGYGQNMPNIKLVGTYSKHTEFVMGLDWNLFEENMICSASWDRSVCAWKFINPIRK